MRRAWCVFFLLIMTAVSVRAQAPVPFSIYAGGGVAFPLQPDTSFADDTHPGLNLMLGVSYDFVPLLQGMLKAEYVRFGNKLPGSFEDYDWHIWLIGLSARAGIPVSGFTYQPYILAGGGAGISQRTEGVVGTVITYPPIERTTDVYFEIGAGVETSVNRTISLFAEGKYIHVSRDPEALSHIPVVVGLKLF